LAEMIELRKWLIYRKEGGLIDCITQNDALFVSIL